MEPAATATDTPVQSYFINRTLNKVNNLPSVRVSPVDTDVEHAVQTCLQLLAVGNFEFEAVHLVVLSDDKDSNLTVRLQNAPAAFMNLLRISFADVPVMVIDEVTFKQVPLVVPTQVLAHRFGLLPVFIDPCTLDIPTLTFCAKGEVSSRQLQPVKPSESQVAVGVTSYPPHKDPHKPDRLHGPPSVHSDRSCVTRWSSSNISGVGPRDVNCGQTPSRSVVGAGITITYLLPTQTIEGTATISKQTARTHAKAQAAKVFFRMHAVPVVSENSGVIDIEDAADLCAKCPAGVFDIESNSKPSEDESTWLRTHNSMCEDLLYTASPIPRSSSRKRQLKVRYADTNTKTAIDSDVTGCDSPMLTFTVRSHLCTSCGRCRLPLREDEHDHILSVTSTSGLTASSVFYDALQLCKIYFD
jgi:hypothetical protein